VLTELDHLRSSAAVAGDSRSGLRQFLPYALTAHCQQLTV
jgi:hypothetical protein